ncbi:MAG: aspartyl/asparaginyl beta-hydroxylase domain-containing protein [Arenicella sp.]
MELSQLIAGLIAGDQHQGGLRCMQLFTLNRSFMEKLQYEVESYCQTHSASDISEPSHVTNWVHTSGEVIQYSLLNHSGLTNDFSTDHDLSCKGKWFFDEMQYPTIGKLINCWPHLINFRINVLQAGSILAAHEEHIPFRTQSDSIGARLRFHLPVFTNKDAELNLDNHIYHLPTGAINLVNQGCVHSAKNNGGNSRIHLVWDALLTEKLYHFLFHHQHQTRFLQPDKPVPAQPQREEEIGPYRRLPPQVQASELSELSICLPQ